jgi:hypothetical protein
MEPVAPSTVAVRPGAALAANRRLFDALEAALPVRFRPWRRREQSCDGLIVLGTGIVPARPDGAPDVPMLALAGSASSPAPAEDVRLADHAGVDRRLRGVVLPSDGASIAMGVAEGEQVMASGPSGPFWTLTEGPVRVHRVRAVLPVLKPDEVLRDALTPERAFALVGLVQFLRELVGERWQAPPLRAAIIFDDPNLRRPSYGYIDYRGLAAHADAHGYHAAMAMIPRDARRPHAGAVDTFRSRSDRLSLVIHGNDHLKRELMQPLDLARALELAAQAVRRVARFEARTGLCVDRVMVPPHGLCSRTMTRALGALGYDALCAIHPYPWTERPPRDHLLAGWAPTAFLAGCAMLPRFPLHCSSAETALRAFLDQPLVLYGHHDDLAGGLEPLVEAARNVNRLGEVQWMSLGDIAASSYDIRVEGATAVIRPWGRRVRVALPAGVTDLVVEAPAMTGADAALRGWRPAASAMAAPLAFGAAAPVAGGREALVELVSQWEADAWSVRAPAWRPWPGVRRAATETRDRLLPVRAAFG